MVWYVHMYVARVVGVGIGWSVRLLTMDLLCSRLFLPLACLLASLELPQSHACVRSNSFIKDQLELEPNGKRLITDRNLLPISDQLPQPL